VTVTKCSQLGTGTSTAEVKAQCTDKFMDIHGTVRLGVAGEPIKTSATLTIKPYCPWALSARFL